MRVARKSVTFLMIAVLTAFVMAVFFAPLAADCLSVLTNGWGQRKYLAAGTGGETVALVSRTDNGFRLTMGTLDGMRTGEWTSVLPTAADCTIAGIYPASDSSVFLGVYETATQAAENLAVYRLSADGGVERLLVHPCKGDSAAERMASAVLSGFSEQEGIVSFALTDEDTVQAYTYGSAEGGLTQGVAQQTNSAASAAVLADGTVALGGAGWLTLDGRPVSFPVENHIVTNLTQVGAGLYYVDSASLKVFYSDLTGTGCAEVLDLSHVGTLDGLTSLSLTRDGGALLLWDGHTLELVQSSGTIDLSGLLYRSFVSCMLILIGLVLLWMVCTLILWYLLCVRQRSHLPLVIRAGGTLAVGTLLVVVLLANLLVKPMIHSNMAGEVENVLAAAAALAAERGGSEEMLPARVAAGLSTLTAEGYAQVSVAAYETDGTHWTVCGSSGRLPTGSSAGLSPYFSVALAEQAMQQGSAFAVQDGVYCLSLRMDTAVLQVTLASVALETQLAKQDARAMHGLWAGAALLWAIAMLILLAVGHNLRRMVGAMEQLVDGDTTVRLMVHTGDELEGLAASFNSMAHYMQQQEQKRDDLIHAYLRFVPERVLRLLGKKSILDVDKRTFAARRLSAMMVWFEFPGRVYDNSTRALFESINEVIERTAAIVARKGGTVFNFAYNGYDVVLDGSETTAISTAVAVQQEVLSLNEQRAVDGLPTVTLRIALDIGEVMIGIVGDETQMEPATISASFTTARRLIGLAGRLQAGILCTENVIAGAEGYGSRYMGKSHQGDELIRVYEIFDGDPYGVRRSKENTGRRFSEGVFALYSHDFSTAKRIFLELVHDNPGDGGACYYLYLADRLEKQPDQEISLES